MSFYSSELYRDIALNWRGVGLLYLFFLVVLGAVPITVKAQLGYGGWLDGDARDVIAKIPRITITNGEVSTDVETPYYIPMPPGWATGQNAQARYLAVIDLTGTYASAREADTLVLLTESAISFRNRNETRSYDLSGVQRGAFDGSDVAGWLNAVRPFVAPLVYVGTLLSTYVYRIAQVAIYALIGFLFGKMFRVRLEYPAVMRLMAVAITPALVLNEIVFSFGAQPPGWSWICFGLAMAYLAYAERSCAQRTPPDLV